MEEHNDEYDDEPVEAGFQSGEEENEFFNGDEAEEDNTLNEDGTKKSTSEPKPVKVKRAVLNPQPKLNFEALQGPKGLLALNKQLSNFKFRGSGKELEDITDILKNLEQWAFRLFPKFHFEDSLKRLEALGKKREVQVYLRKIRNGMIDADEVVRQVDDDDEEDDGNNMAIDVPLVTHDPFDDLLSQQISFTQTVPQVPPSLSEEQRLRMERNKLLAMEKRLKNLNTSTTVEVESVIAVDSNESLKTCTTSTGMDFVEESPIPSVINNKSPVPSTSIAMDFVEESPIPSVISNKSPVPSTSTALDFVEESPVPSVINNASPAPSTSTAMDFVEKSPVPPVINNKSPVPSTSTALDFVEESPVPPVINNASPVLSTSTAMHFVEESPVPSVINNKSPVPSTSTAMDFVDLD